MSPQYVRAKVSGVLPVRDSLTRESVEQGGYVVLQVREPDQERTRCPRHPKKGVHRAAEPCWCGGVLIAPLVEQGAITDVKPHDPAKAEKKS